MISSGDDHKAKLDDDLKVIEEQTYGIAEANQKADDIVDLWEDAVEEIDGAV